MLNEYGFLDGIEDFDILMKALEADTDDDDEPIDITDENAEEDSFGEDSNDNDITDDADNQTSNIEDDIEKAAADDAANEDDESTDGSNTDEGDDMSDDSGDLDDGLGEDDNTSSDEQQNDIYTDPNKISETKKLMIHLYNNIKESIETITSISLLYPIKSDRLELVKNDLIQLNSIIFKIITSKKETKSYPELLKKYYGCKEFYGVKLETVINIIKHEISEYESATETKPKKYNRKSNKKSNINE